MSSNSYWVSGDQLRIPKRSNAMRKQWDANYLSRVRDFFGESNHYEPASIPISQVEGGRIVMPGHPRTAFYQRLYRLDPKEVPPIVVNDIGNGFYNSLDGSRRLAAAKAAGVTHVPGLIVRDAPKKASKSKLPKSSSPHVYTTTGAKKLGSKLGKSEEPESADFGPSLAKNEREVPPALPPRLARAMWAIRQPGVLTDELRKPEYRSNPNPVAGHCFVAANALYHLINGARTGWDMKVIHKEHLKDLADDTHWFLQHRKTGHILDPTADQFEGNEVPYHKGVGCGTSQNADDQGHPTKRAQVVIDRAKAVMSESPKEYLGTLEHDGNEWYIQPPEMKKAEGQRISLDDANGLYDWFHISSQEPDEHGQFRAEPRVPGLNSIPSEDKKTPRICVGPSIHHCIAGLLSAEPGDDDMVERIATDPSMVNKFRGRHVYGVPKRAKVTIPTREQVPDAPETGEGWLTKPTTFQHVGRLSADQRGNTIPSLGEPYLQKAEPKLKAGGLVSQSPDGRHEEWNYSHLLPQKTRDEGYGLKMQLDKEFRTAHIFATKTRDGQTRPAGYLQGLWHNDKKAIKPWDVKVLDQDRRKRLGLSMYEALYAHAKAHLGLTSVVGDIHSTSSHLIHKKLAAKHGLDYDVKGPSAEEDAAFFSGGVPEDYDSRFGKYKYALPDVAKPKEVNSFAEHRLPGALDSELGKKLQVINAGDRDENVQARSWHTDPQAHADFAKALFGFANGQLDQPIGHTPLGKAERNFLKSPAFRHPGTGKVVATPVFHDSSVLAQKVGLDESDERLDDWEAGYVDHAGNFYDREMAAAAVLKQGKVPQPPQPHLARLDIPGLESEQYVAGRKAGVYKSEYPVQSPYVQPTDPQNYLIYQSPAGHHVLTPGGNEQTFDTAEKRDKYLEWHRSLRNQQSGVKSLGMVKSGDDLEKTIKDLLPGTAQGDKYNRWTDYSHLLPKEHREKLELFVTDDRAYVTATLSNRRSKNSHLSVMGQISGKAMRPDVVNLGLPERMKGLGLATYEALYAHSYHKRGIRSILGEHHTAAADGVHRALARKHGLNYQSSFDPKAPSAEKDFFGMHRPYGPYKYALKSELVAFHKRALDPNAGYQISSTPHTMGLRVSAHDPQGEVGYAIVGKDDRGLHIPHIVHVNPAHQRKGIASAMYAHAEQKLGVKLSPSDIQSEHAQKLWTSANRPFGKSEIDVADISDPELSGVVAQQLAGKAHVGKRRRLLSTVVSDPKTIKNWLDEKVAWEGPPDENVVDSIGVSGAIHTPIFRDEVLGQTIDGRHRLAAALKYGLSVPALELHRALGKSEGLDLLYARSVSRRKQYGAKSSAWKDPASGRVVPGRGFIHDPMDLDGHGDADWQRGYIIRDGSYLDAKTFDKLSTWRDASGDDFGKSEIDPHEHAAAVVVCQDDQGHTLWGKRKDGKYTMPGGHVNEGELPIDGAVRELHEEAGLTSENMEFLGAGNGLEGPVYVYKATAYGTPTTENDPDREFDELVWVDCIAGLPVFVAQNLAHNPDIACQLMGWARPPAAPPSPSASPVDPGQG